MQHRSNAHLLVASFSRTSFSRTSFSRTLRRVSGACLSLGAAALTLCCESQAVDLGGDTVAQGLTRASRCAESGRIEDDIVIGSQVELAALAGCEEIGGNLIVKLFPGADLTPLSSLRVVEGQFALGVQQSWDQILGYQISDYFDEQVDLIRAGWLQSLVGVQSLERVGSLFLRGLPDADLSAFESLGLVAGDDDLGFIGQVILQQNLELRDLTGFEDVQGVKNLVVTLSPSLESLSGFAPGAQLGSISLYTSPALTDLGALAQVSALDGLILYQIGISDLDDLAALGSVRDGLSITGNLSLEDASGLALQQQAPERISITGNAVLQLLPPFSGFASQPKMLQIRDNPALETLALDFANAQTQSYFLEGFAGQPDSVSVELGMDVIDIRNNQSLQSLSVRSGLTLAQLMVVGDNAALESVDFGSLSQLGQLSMTNNAALSRIGIGALARVASLQVTGNPLLPTAVFDGVQTFSRDVDGNAD
ncbi:MAG: hypothetical protein ABI895_33270 [Deltaproteobacteria bacterium]